MESLKAAIEAGLRQKDDYILTVEKQVSSTNGLVKEWGKQGFPHGSVLIAGQQTAGRGRLGRQFFSSGEGLYFSILLRPELSPKDTLRLTTAAAVAVANAIGQEARIKWVNDVYRKGRKVCGILTEAAVSGERLQYAVVGIGLNLWRPADGYPQEIQEIAGPIFDEKPTNQQIADLMSRILNGFYEACEDLFAPWLWERYRERHLLQGKTVTVGQLTGVVTGIDPQFGLLVRTPDGKEHTVTAGEATIGSTAIKEE